MMVGVALVDGVGDVAAVIGVFNSFRAIKPGETLAAKMNCSVPDDVAPGRGDCFRIHFSCVRRRP